MLAVPVEIIKAERTIKHAPIQLCRHEATQPYAAHVIHQREMFSADHPLCLRTS
jgi:hypothetical protein